MLNSRERDQVLVAIQEAVKPLEKRIETLEAQIVVAKAQKPAAPKPAAAPKAKEKAAKK